LQLTPTGDISAVVVVVRVATAAADVASC